MTFEVAGSADPGDGSRRREPPVTSVAGEVLKKKLQLNKNAVPPPPLPSSLRPEFSQLERQPDEGTHWEEEEDYHTMNMAQFQRSSDALGTSNRNASSFVASSNHASSRPMSLSATELVKALETLLIVSPHLKPYIQFKLPLERKGSGKPEFPISPFLYKSSCEICLDHGDVCTVDQGESASRCEACTRFGGRCIFLNLEGTTASKHETHFNCGRCALDRTLRNPPFTHADQPFSPSKFLELKNRMKTSREDSQHNQRSNNTVLAEVKQPNLIQLDLSKPAAQSSRDAQISYDRTVSATDSSRRSKKVMQTRPVASTSIRSSWGSHSDETSSDARSSAISSPQFDQLAETSSLSSAQESASDSLICNGYIRNRDGDFIPLFLHAVSEKLAEPGSKKLCLRPGKGEITHSTVKNDTAVESTCRTTASKQLLLTSWESQGSEDWLNSPRPGASYFEKQDDARKETTKSSRNPWTPHNMVENQYRTRLNGQFSMVLEAHPPDVLGAEIEGSGRDDSAWARKPRLQTELEHLKQAQPEQAVGKRETDSDTGRLESLFAQPRARLFEPVTLPTNTPSVQSYDQGHAPWQKYRKAKVVPYEPAKPLFQPKTKKERQMEMTKNVDKVYIPRNTHDNGPVRRRLNTAHREISDTQDAREQLQYGFVEAQGGEPTVRREIRANGDDGDGKDVQELKDEELTTEQYWRRKLEENFDSVSGSFWEHEPRRHR